MRYLLCFSLYSFTVTLMAADFPSPDKLPAQPGLPDPLVMFNGDKVTTKEQWLQKRRPELKSLFEHYMYGKHPAPHKIETKVLHEDANAFGGKATLREIAFYLAGVEAPTFHVLLVVPNKREAAVPVFVGLNFCGNHAIVNDPKVRIPTVWMYPNRKGVKDNKATEEGRGTEIDTWALEQSVDRGYAVATLYNGEIDPDRKEVRGSLEPFVVPKVKGEAVGNETATVMLWAWGVHRVIDHLTTLKEIDAKRIAAVGHSRLGKAALVAGAFDERIALTIPHQAGCGGSGPSRSQNPKAESVERINTSFPHWFNGNFKAFNKSVERLPFDQHSLVALCAPRAVLFTNALDDQWANPSGQFDNLKAADPVYRLLGSTGMEATTMPEPDGKLIDSTLGYWIRTGKHSMTKQDWKVFLDFADKHLRK